MFYSKKFFESFLVILKLKHNNYTSDKTIKAHYSQNINLQSKTAREKEEITKESEINTQNDDIC